MRQCRPAKQCRPSNQRHPTSSARPTCRPGQTREPGVAPIRPEQTATPHALETPPVPAITAAIRLIVPGSSGAVPTRVTIASPPTR